MKRIMTIFLSMVMIFSCSYTAMANDSDGFYGEYLDMDIKRKINMYPRVNVVDGKNIKDISMNIEGEYITKHGFLMVPAVDVLKEMGFDVVEYDAQNEILSANKTSNQWAFKLNCKDGAKGYYGFNIGDGEVIYGNTLIQPIILNDTPFIALKDLSRLTGDAVYANGATVTYYIVLNHGKDVDSAITSLPSAGSSEKIISYKYSNEKEYRAYIVLNEGSIEDRTGETNISKDDVVLDISEIVRPQKVGWDVMFESEALFKALGTNVKWIDDKNCLTATKNGRTMSIYYDGSNTLAINNEKKQTNAALKVVDGIARVLYSDAAWLIDGYRTHFTEYGEIFIFVDKDSWYTNRETQAKVEESDSGVKIKVNGKQLSDAQAILKDGTTLLPVRSVSTALGGNVTWDNTTKTVIIEKAGTTIIAPVGQKYILVNGKSKACNIPPQIIEGKTYIPLRVIGEALSCNITWINETKTVEIN